MFSRTIKDRHLLSRIGGPTALEAAVEIFYEKLVADKSLAKFFEGIDVNSLKNHQRRFLTLVFTEIPKDLDLALVMQGTHARLFDMGLNERHFDTFVGHLVATLKDMQIKKKFVDEVVAVMAPFRPIFECGKQQHLIDRIGGSAALEAAVDIFYEKIVGDPTLAKFFEGTDMNNLKAHQRGFLTLALTEIPQDVDVPNIIASKHKRLFRMGLNEIHFDSVAGHLISTLDGLQVKKKDIDEIAAIVTPLRDIFKEGAKQAA
mmetsp:Transcript_6989/g.11603  ORF Transcript_6989/g.11603 Transcript_6989/m.11603 type:complete len:260 (-) Transcript_6989:383-1162(-)